ncbi:MAG: isoaspartyl peptidase/L-asparaginase [Trueperaceae bacterium]|nr:isoaspartyl peptidase/L-asparaginase [Trueperaceae bacterium]MCO5173576.1 isoaspartyl peptidase/L-asparaginase [Trueperaceae bacterium]MCW5818564.1 isoaspartyl peptidase/L-asparaginase [Trueperaceae bacterium]
MIAIVIHGGAGKIAADDRVPYLAGLERARDVGYRVLADGGTAVAAILAAVTTMEDDLAAFNAGTGGSPNRDGAVECDAAIMSADGTSGAVAAVTRAKNPILLADKVRTATPHALIVGAGADALVEHPIDNAQLLTPRTRRALERWREDRDLGPKGSATVGAVALDDHGMLAAATSTGGMLGKWPGRVGDAPLIGAGTYAARHVGVSCTGDGEAFIRAVTSKGLADRLRAGVELGAAVRSALDEVAVQNATGGVIVLTADGHIASGFNARDMAYAWRTPGGADACVSAEPGVRLVG